MSEIENRDYAECLEWSIRKRVDNYNQALEMTEMQEAMDAGN